jgi:Fe-Mn family superoxide dismutase
LEKETDMAFELPSLPYSHAALAERGMSQETLELHHDKHHQAYVTALNGFVEKDAALQGKSLEELVTLTYGDDARAGVFNQAGQHWNHLHFWNALSPKGGGLPGKLEGLLVEGFGSVDAFKDMFKTAATTQFGSGWAWLIQKDDGSLGVTKTPNGVNPLATQGEGTALLGLDVWEHSYYVDFRNRRPDYVTNFLDNLANYEFAESNLR